MKRDGFIATSLIYSFFLVFLAIIAGLLNNFIANKTIIDRFNDNAIDKMNGDFLTVTVYSKNANIQDGVTISNLLSNGNFKENTSYWNFITSYFSREEIDGEGALLKQGNGTTYEYAYELVQLLGGDTYYLSIDYKQDHDLMLHTYLNAITSGINSPSVVTSNNGATKWSKDSQVFKTTTDAIYEFRIGDSRNNRDNYSTYFKNAMLLNLTAAFGAGYEPDRVWIDDNIRFIDGTISYIQLSEIESDDSVEVKLVPYASLLDGTKCIVAETGEEVPSSNYVVTKDTGSNTYTLTIDKVAKSLICDVNWR